MDFTPTVLKYVYTPLTMDSGQFFGVNSILRTSQTDPNDFLFAGKSKSLTDGTITQIFLSVTGFIMKGKTSDFTQNCFSFTSGYALSLSNLCTEPFMNANLGFNGGSGGENGNPVIYKPTVI